MSQQRTINEVFRALKDTVEYDHQGIRDKIYQGLFWQYLKWLIFTEIPQCFNLEGEFLGYEEFKPNFNTQYFDRIIKVGRLQRIKRGLDDNLNGTPIDERYGLEDI